MSCGIRYLALKSYVGGRIDAFKEEYSMNPREERACNRFAQLLCYYQQEVYYHTPPERFEALKYPHTRRRRLSAGSVPRHQAQSSRTYR